MHQFKAIVICLLGASFLCFDYFIQVMPGVMTKQLILHFHLHTVSLTLLSSSFFLPYCMMQLPAGLLLQRFGAKKNLCPAALISAIALFLFAHTSSWQVAIIARSLLGACAAFSFVGAIYLVSQWFPARLFAPLAGAVQLTGTLGSIIGLAPIANALRYHSWQDIIITMGWFALALSILFALVIKDRVIVKSKRSPPALRETVFYCTNNPKVLLVFLIGFLSWVPITSIGALWGVPYLTQISHMNTTQASDHISWLWIGLAIGSVFVGWLSEQWQTQSGISSICFLIGFIASLFVILCPHAPPRLLSVSFFLLGLSAANQSLSFAYLKDLVPAHLFSGLSGINNMSAILGGATAQLCVGFCLSFLQHGSQSHHTLSQYQTALSIVPLSALLGLTVCYYCFYTKTFAQPLTQQVH